MSLALTHRPSSLKDVVGNEAEIKALRSVLSKPVEQIQHAFLLTGPSGCGKTTLARIIADSLYCKGRDYTEVDSADFRGIDSIRDIRQQMNYLPMEGRCKVYLLDECHQLSKDAQNALLKALEDTPDHVYFILATTDPEKLLATIRGRCATFSVKPLEQDEMVTFLRGVVSKERKRVSPEILKQIARDSVGSCRNALQILDKVIDLSAEDMAEAAEQVAQKTNEVIELCQALFQRKPWKTVAKIIDGIKEEPESIRLAVIGYCSRIMLSGTDSAAAYLVLDYFKDPQYNNGKAGIVWAAYSVLETGK